MIKGKANITTYFEQQHKPYFALFYKGKVESGHSHIVRNDKDDADSDYDSAKRLFDEYLNLLSHGDYTLVVDDKKNVTTRGAARIDFNIPMNEATATPAVSGAPALSMADVEARASQIAEQKFEQLMLKKENADLKEKNKELEKGLKEAEKSVNEPLNKFIGALAPHSETIVAGIFGKQSAPAGELAISNVTPDHVAEADPEAQAICEEFIKTLAAAKPNEWKDILKKLTGLIKDNPGKFNMALNLL